MLKLKWAAVPMACAFILWHLAEDRIINSPITDASHVPNPAEEIIRREKFTFEKSGKVKFEFSEKAIEQKIEGELFLDWTDEKMATISLTVGEETSTVFLRAQFQKNFQLECFEVPLNLTDQENDTVTLLRDLLLNYSFRTNRDENGDYAAVLKTKSDDLGNTQLTKVKMKYLDPSKEALKVENSLHVISLTPHLEKAEGTEEFTLDNNGQRAFATVRYSLLALKKEVTRPLLNLERPMGVCLQDYLTDTHSTSFTSAEEFKDGLNQIKVSDHENQLRLSRKIVKAIKSNSQHLSAFMDWVQSIKSNRQLSALALGILGNLGTPAAQKELVGLFQDSSEGPGHIHYQVLNTFTLTKSALTTESREFLRARIHEDDVFTEGAAYALGASIQNNKESLESHRDLNFLVNELDQVVDPQAKVIYLDALKNSGSPDAFATYKKYSLSEDEFIREKALEALQTIQGNEKLLIYKTALNDPSQKVRAAALEGLSLLQD